jgi:hypothetical protein
MRCSSWLGGLVAQKLRDPEVEWDYEEGNHGSYSTLKLYKSHEEKQPELVTKFYHSCFSWRLVLPEVKLPRNDKRILDSLAHQRVEEIVEKERRAKEDEQIKRLVTFDQEQTEELLKPSQAKRDYQHLQWIYDRLCKVHGEDRNHDYMHKLQTIIDRREPIHERTDEEQESFNERDHREYMEHQDYLAHKGLLSSWRKWACKEFSLHDGRSDESLRGCILELMNARIAERDAFKEDTKRFKDALEKIESHSGTDMATVYWIKDLVRQALHPKEPS